MENYFDKIPYKAMYVCLIAIFVLKVVQYGPQVINYVLGR